MSSAPEASNYIKLNIDLNQLTQIFNIYSGGGVHMGLRCRNVYTEPYSYVLHTTPACVHHETSVTAH